MKFQYLIFVFSLITLHVCHPQLTSNQPYFRSILSLLPIPNLESRSFPQSTYMPVVSISDGAIRGFITTTANGRSILAFQRIPFAQPPVGSLRFQDPVKNSPWNGTLEAFRESPVCIQIDFVLGGIVHGEENCLYLNVYTPQLPNSTETDGLPVMVFIHGGAFSHSSGSLVGPRYLLDQDIILVTFNYRLGPFGFFSTGDSASPGNQGLKDQVLALKWVQRNIAAFGGNPNSVTIFGQSSGASSVGLHIVSPLSRGLFHRAIMQSGSSLCYMAGARNASEVARRVGEVFGCPLNSTQEMVDCLRNVPEKVLAPVQLKFVEWLLLPIFWFTPTVEHEHSNAFITKTPEKYYESGEAANVTIIAGLTKNEMSLHVSIFIRDFVHISELNSDWDRVGPIAMELNYGPRDVQIARVRRLWIFYMGDKKLSWETRLNFARMYSDRHVTECTLEAMRYHSFYTNQSVYAYVLSYLGRYSQVQQTGQKPEDWGVVHGDDLMYLLDNPTYYPSLNRGDPELEMSHIMTSIWSNFATYDRPYLSGNNSSQDIWQPIVPVIEDFSPLRFLDINLNSTMISDPYTSRYIFWREIIAPNP